MPTRSVGVTADAPNDSLVAALARARAHGLPGYQVAGRVGVHPSELSRWCYGHKAPTPAQRRRLAAALGCEVEDLFPLNEVEPGGQAELDEKGVTAPDDDGS